MQKAFVVEPQKIGTLFSFAVISTDCIFLTTGIQNAAKPQLQRNLLPNHPY